MGLGIQNSRLRVLIIDDSQRDRHLIENLLLAIPEQTYDVESASTWEKGLERVRQQVHDIYLVDYMLGARTGLDLLKEATLAGNTRPVILLTGLAEEGIEIEALELGATDFVTKDSLYPELLHRSIQYALERKKIEQRLRVLNDIARLVNGRLDLNSVLNASAEGLSSMLTAERLAIFVCDHDEELMRLAFVNDTKDAKDSALKTSFPLRGTRFEQCLLHRQPIYCSDLGKTASDHRVHSLQESLKKDSTRSGAAAVHPARPFRATRASLRTASSPKSSSRSFMAKVRSVRWSSAAPCRMRSPSQRSSSCARSPIT